MQKKELNLTEIITAIFAIPLGIVWLGAAIVIGIVVWPILAVQSIATEFKKKQ